MSEEVVYYKKVLLPVQVCNTSEWCVEPDAPHRICPHYTNEYGPECELHRIQLEYFDDGGVKKPDCCLRLVDEGELLEAMKAAMRLIDEMMKFVSKMALQDYALLNEGSLQLRMAIARMEKDRG